MMNPFQAVIPLGGWCRMTAQARSYFDFKKAYPMDWLIAPTPSVIAMLEHRFEGFLDPDRLKLRSDLDGVTCLRYGIQHKHDFLRDVDHKTLPAIRDQLGEVRAKYAYRLSNLQAVGDLERALFIRHDDVPVFDNHEEDASVRHRRATADDAQRIYAALQAMFPRVQVVLLCINFAEPAGERDGIVYADEPKNYEDAEAGSFLGSSRGWAEMFSTHGLQLETMKHKSADPDEISIPMPGYY